MKNILIFTLFITLFFSCDLSASGKSSTIDLPDPNNKITNISALPINNGISITWTDSLSAKYKSVEITWTPVTGVSQPMIILPDIESAIISGLSNGTEYSISIKTLDIYDRVCDTQTLVRSPYEWKIGDVIISEVLANPSGTDSGKEYIEIYNTTNEDLWLGRCNIGSYIIDFTNPDFPAKTYKLIAEEMYYPQTDGRITLGLTNSNAYPLSIIVDSLTLDTIQVPVSISTEGRSYQLSATKLDHVFNDSASNWSSTSNAYPIPGTSIDYGTPRTANEILP